MNYQQLISTNIKALRLEHHLTQEEFAEKIGISLQGLSNIERNRYQPTAETVDKICKAFDITPVQLLLTNVNTNKELIQNITAILSVCTTKKLKKIYDIITIIIK